MVNADAAGTEGAAIPTLGPDTLGALLEAQAAARPDAVALLAPRHEPLTYAELLGQVRATVEALNAFGIGRGDRVAVVLPNGPEMATAFLGVAAGTTCAPLNPADRAEELRFALGDLRINALVVAVGSDSPAVAAAHDGGIAVVELVTRPADRAGAFTLRGAA